MKRLFIILGIFVLISIGKASALTSVGLISDTILTQTNPYNYYYKTPDFIIQDISDLLKADKNIVVIPYSKTREIIKKKNLKESLFILAK